MPAEFVEYWCVGLKYGVRGPEAVLAAEREKSWRLKERIDAAGYLTVVQKSDTSVRLFRTRGEAIVQAVAWQREMIARAEEALAKMRKHLAVLES